MRRNQLGVIVFSALTIAVLGCSKGGSVIANASKLESTTLTVARVACTGAVSNCAPTNLQGRVFAAGAMLGAAKANDAYNMTFLADSDDIINDPSSTNHPEGTLLFNLLSPTVFSGKISIPSSDKTPNPPVIPRIETYFDFIDATFTLSGTSGVNGAYTVRTVFRKTATASDVTSGQTMQIADKLIKADGQTTFRWCTVSNCSNTTRPVTPLQDAYILSVYNANDGRQGNKNYVSYAVDLITELTVSYAEISDPTRLWTIDYDVTTAIGFTATPSTFSAEKDIVNAFKLEFGCQSESCTTNDNRIKGTLTIGAPGSAS